jgi:hypothetical protein
MIIKSITIAIIAATSFTTPSFANQALLEALDIINGGSTGTSHMMNRARQNAAREENMRMACVASGREYSTSMKSCY